MDSDSNLEARQAMILSFFYLALHKNGFYNEYGVYISVIYRLHMALPHKLAYDIVCHSHMPANIIYAQVGQTNFSSNFSLLCKNYISTCVDFYLLISM